MDDGRSRRDRNYSKSDARHRGDGSPPIDFTSISSRLETDPGFTSSPIGSSLVTVSVAEEGAGPLEEARRVSEISFGNLR